MLSLFYYLRKNDRINLRKSVGFFVSNKIFKDKVNLTKEIDKDFIVYLNELNRPMLANDYLRENLNIKTRYPSLIDVKDNEMRKHLEHCIDYYIGKKLYSVVFTDYSFSKEENLDMSYLNDIGFVFKYKENNNANIKLPSNVRPYIDPQAIKDRILKIYNKNYYVSNNLRANVYFAGKINPNDWRHHIFPNLKEIEDKDYNETFPIDFNFKYAGPYFNKDIEQPEMFEEYIKWIDKSDVIFAYINDAVHYGTLWELGYAFAKNKKVIISLPYNFMNKKLVKEILIICQGADAVFYEKDIESAWKMFKKTYDLMINNKSFKQSSEIQLNYIIKLYEEHCFSRFNQEELYRLGRMGSSEIGGLLGVFKTFEKEKDIDKIKQKVLNNPIIVNM